VNGFLDLLGLGCSNDLVERYLLLENKLLALFFTKVYHLAIICKRQISYSF